MRKITRTEHYIKPYIGNILLCGLTARKLPDLVVYKRIFVSFSDIFQQETQNAARTLGFNYFEGGYGYDRKKKVRQQNLVVVYSSAYVHKVCAENDVQNTPQNAINSDG